MNKEEEMQCTLFEDVLHFLMQCSSMVSIVAADNALGKMLTACLLIQKIKLKFCPNSVLHILLKTVINIGILIVSSYLL